MCADGPARGDGAGARPRLTGAVVLTVLGPAVAFSVSGVDPLLLTLNLPEVSRALNVPAGLVGFLGGAATLVVAAAVLAVGHLGDRWGLKRLLMCALATSIAVNGVAALSPGYVFLLIMRLLDGLALAALLGLTLALLTESVPAQVRPKAIGVFMATDTVLYGLSPLAGGLVVQWLGWRGLFLVAPLLAAAALALTARYVPVPARGREAPLDVAGIALFGTALLGLVYGIGEVPRGISQPRAWVPLAACLLTLTAFVLRERRARAPALDLGLLRQPAFAVAIAAVVTINFLAAGLSVILGQFGGAVLALPASAIGLLYLPGTALIAAASLLAGHLIAVRTARPVLIAGLLTTVASGLLLAGTASPTMALWMLVLATWLGNLGYFVSAIPVSDTVLAHARPGKAGAVAAVQPAFGMTGYALGPTVFILLLNVFFQQEWLANAQAQGLSVKQARSAVNAVTSALAHSPGTARYDPNLAQQASGLSLGIDFSDGVRLTMLIVSALPLVVAVAAYFLLPRRRAARRSPPVRRG